MRSRLLFSSVFLGLCLFFGFPLISNADTLDGSTGLQVTPSITRLNADPGGTYFIKITVTNTSPNSTFTTGNINDFDAQDETGTPNILETDESSNSANSFKNWADPIGQVILAPKQSKQIKIKVKVPENADPGGHYGIITFGIGENPTSGEANVGLRGGIGSLVLVTVSGDVVENLSIKEFYTANYKSNDKTGFFQNGPIKIVSRFENQGNVHLQPTGLITVKNIFGSTVASLQISDIPGNVLPKSIRKFEQSLDNKWLFGKYTVSLDAKYGAYNTALLAKTSFWVIPIKLIAIAIIILAAIIFIGKKGIKGYNKRIIAKHSGK